jgi:hypothetical protein
MKKENQYTYDQVAFPLLFVSVVMLFLASTWNMENQIESLKLELQDTTDSLCAIIDSMQCEIDTLTWETEIWDYNVEYNTTHLLSALMFVESGNNDSAHAIGEDAVGCLQIRKTMVDDVNRILKRQGKDYRFTYDDRWLRNKSIQMFDIYCKHYGLTTAEEIARCWNGGPRGMDKDATSYYWEKVQNHLDS